MSDLGPDTLEHWRNSALGTITERLEKALILSMAGEIRGRQVLDVGTGDGTYAIAAAERGATVTAVDTNEAMLHGAARRAHDAAVAIEWIRGDINSLPFADATFDVVMAVTVLCFVPDARAAVAECGRVLKPGGTLVVGELGRWSVWALHRRLRAWLGDPLWGRSKFHSLRDLRHLLSSAGLDPVAQGGAVYYPPITLLAHRMERLDRRLSVLGDVGAAFVAVAGAQARAVSRPEPASGTD